MASDFANDNCLFCPNAATKTGFFSGYIFRNESIKARIFWGLCATSNMMLTPSTLHFSNRPGIVICTDFFRASFGRGGFYLALAAFQRRGTPMSNSAAENPAVFSENRQ